MGLKDLFKRGKRKEEERTAEDEPREVNIEEEKKEKKEQKYSDMLQGVDKSQLSMKEKMALGMFKKMSAKKQENLLRKAMNPQEIHKHKDKMLKQIDDMVKSGEIDKSQAEAAKSRLGLR